MSELTLENLAARIAELEREVTSLKSKAPAVIPASRDWCSVVGMFEDSDFMRQVDAEVLALRNAETYFECRQMILLDHVTNAHCIHRV